MAQGTMMINFGAFPGKSDATVAVSGLGGETLVEAWIMPVATADHSVDEHWVDPPEVKAGAISAGSFTVYGKAPQGFPVKDPVATRGQAHPGGVTNRAPRCYGLWSVAWAAN